MSVTFPGTAGIKFEWEGDTPPSVAYKIASLEAYLMDTVALAEMAKEELVVDMMEKFESESDPEGHSWDELVQPEAEQIGILRRGSTNAQMYHDAISERAWEVRAEGVYFDTSALPPYWAFHDQPDRGEYRIPRRAFIDPTVQAQVAIEGMAARWLDIGVAYATRGVGGGLVSSPSTGQFIGAIGQTTVIGGIARRELKDPSTGRFVSTRPEFYQ